jgi:hypothetical protein
VQFSDEQLALIVTKTEPIDDKREIFGLSFEKQAWSGRTHLTMSPQAGLDATQPVVASDAWGHGMAAWVQPRMDNANQHEVRVVPFLLGQGWQVMGAQDIPCNRAATDTPALAFDDQGRAYMAWLEGDGVSFARYEAL